MRPKPASSRAVSSFAGRPKRPVVTSDRKPPGKACLAPRATAKAPDALGLAPVKATPELAQHGDAVAGRIERVRAEVEAKRVDGGGGGAATQAPRPSRTAPPSGRRAPDTSPPPSRRGRRRPRRHPPSCSDLPWGPPLRSDPLHDRDRRKVTDGTRRGTACRVPRPMLVSEPDDAARHLAFLHGVEGAR